jgi:hypothetical protein
MVNVGFKLLSFLLLVGATVAFVPVATFLPTQVISPTTFVRPSACSLWLAEKEEGEYQSSNDTVVTKEMFLREVLRHPDDDEADDAENAPSVTVKRQNKKGKMSNTKAYKVFDNRDSLPFAVTVTTPDPYTHPDLKKESARRQSVVPRKRHDAVENSISSSLYIDSNNGSSSSDGTKKRKKGKKDRDDSESMEVDTSTWLGDFVLDKLTTTGDILEVGDLRYKVVQHSCQYKYAGGQRFVMARKILQVKEVGRIQTEEYLKAQLEASENISASFPPEEQ